MIDGFLKSSVISPVKPKFLLEAAGLFFKFAIMEKDLMQQVSNRIKDVLKLKKMNRIEFAKIMGVQPSVVTRWLSGQHNFTLWTLCQIEAKLGERVIDTVGKEINKSITLKYFGAA